MSSQHQPRPWFRLASIRSAAPPPAPAAPERRPPLTIPSTFRNITSSETAPQPPPSAPAPPAPASPPPPAPAPFATAAPPPPASPVKAVQSLADKLSPSPTTGAGQPQTTSPNKIAATSRRVIPPNQNSSPRTIKPEVQSLKPSPNQKGTTPPSSPLTLPPSQSRTKSEAEPRIPAEPGTGHNGKQVPSKEFESKEKHFHQKISDPKDPGKRVITLAGDNRGAYMEIIRSSKKQESKNLHNNGGSKTKSGGGESEGSNNEDRKAAGNKDSKSRRGKGVSSSFPRAAFMNSNVQCVNNSIMLDSSCEHNDPGDHLPLTKKSSGDGFRFK